MRSLFLLAILAPLAGSAARGQGEPRPIPAATRQEIDRLLREEMTQWYPRVVDAERGGFHENLARDWSVRPDAARTLVYQSRITWTAAAFAVFAPEHREEYVGYAHHGIKYIDEVMRDREQGGFHWAVRPDGTLDPKLGDEKHVYGTSFVLYAASAAREHTGDDLALKVARDAFDWLEAKAHDAEHGGYFEAIARDGTPILGFPPDAPMSKRADRLGVYYGYKSMNSHIHLLEALAAYSRVEDSPKVHERLKEVLEIVRDRIAVEPGALNLYFTRDWRPVPAHDSFGHDIETAYLLVEAAEAAGMADDAKTWGVARSLVDHALDFGWDEANGGFYDKGDTFAANAYDTKKVWWTEAEGLNSLVLMNKRHGNTTKRYADAFERQWAFIARHQLDREEGGWFGEVTREGKPMGDRSQANPWKANYHTSRAMMNVVRMLADTPPGK